MWCMEQLYLAVKCGSKVQFMKADQSTPYLETHKCDKLMIHDCHM